MVSIYFSFQCFVQEDEPPKKRKREQDSPKKPVKAVKAKPGTIDQFFTTTKRKVATNTDDTVDSSTSTTDNDVDKAAGKGVMQLFILRPIRLIHLKKNFYTSTKSWRGYIFTAVCLCVSE